MIHRKREIEAIVDIFETGRAEGDYGCTTILPDGAGISYGRSQATDRADTLDIIVNRYVDAGGTHALALGAYVTQLRANATVHLDPKALPGWCVKLMRLLRAAGADPVMRAVQDAVFDEHYWTPALEHAAAAGLTLPLSLAIVYDTCIQSGPARVPAMRALFASKSPRDGGSERAWATDYVTARRAWLAGFPVPAVQHTVYRCDALFALMRQGAWELAPPLLVRGVTISPAGTREAA